MHTYFMMCHADYMSRFYPFVNRDLLMAGTFCHDLAKAKEYMLSPVGLVTDYSVPGYLLGHLYMGAVEIAKVSQEIGISEEKSLLLQHMLLSHHGKPEYGAAVVPKTAEAMLLSMIDDLDAKMELIRESMEGQAPGMTESVWSLGYKLYNHS
jgi:Predicted HD-superfamily hydrolase